MTNYAMYNGKFVKVMDYDQITGNVEISFMSQNADWIFTKWVDMEELEVGVIK